MTEDELIEALDAIVPDLVDDHIAADELLLKAVSPAVADAYKRVVDRANGAWFFE